MSISLILIPAAIAGVAAATGMRGGRHGEATVVRVQTRMRDETLLAAALADTGAVTETSGDVVMARWSGITARFERGSDGVWSSHVDGANRKRAIEIVEAVDQAYGRHVQKAVLARLRERAPAAGLRLESEEVLDDDAVRLVFEVER
jgi:hypothetical protein